MTYFPTQSEMTYKCPGCQRWYIKGNISCCVIHAPGTCCHMGDVEVSEPTPKTVNYNQSEKLNGGGCGPERD